MASKKKSKKTQVQLIKGMKDILPSEQLIWDFIKKQVFSLARDYGFSLIETPIVESTQLFKRAVGEETDAVSKEMYSFVDQGGEKLSLRPENTAGVVRAYIEHGMLNLPQPVKLFYFAPQFRHDKPQAGRYRQFWQFGFEVIGEKDPIIDAQLISMSYVILQELGITAQIQINSIGDENCRPRYIKALTQYFKEHKKDLCADCQKRLLKNPLRLLDCKVKKCQDIGQAAPQMIDYLCEDCNKDFTAVLEYLDELDINYTLNPKIVRGLDYYTKTAWEIVEGDEEGKLQALGGGGRYDDLVANLGGRETPAIGFAMGVERVINKMKEKKVELPAAHRPDVYLAQLGEEARKKSLRLMKELREAGISISEDVYKNGLKNQLELADHRHAKYALIMGQKEISDETILIRDMESGVQETVDYKKVVKEVQKRLNARVVEKVLKIKAVKK
ncbi:histidine--tRNA ligase [Candidatus Nomurabacteria bacterium]|nr:histidine--tRNA ligase [Candidatus Nomurabacteria bacterium]